MVMHGNFLREEDFIDHQGVLLDAIIDAYNDDDIAKNCIEYADTEKHSQWLEIYKMARNIKCFPEAFSIAILQSRWANFVEAANQWAANNEIKSY